MTARTVVLIAAAILCLTAIAALAQTPCAPHDALAALLAKNHHEIRQSIGITATGQLLEIFVSPAGTWTVLVSTPQGMSCITAAGEGWELIAAKPGEAM